MRNEQLRKNNVVKGATIKESIEVKSLEKDKNTTDYYPDLFDKNKIKNILAVIDSNKFSYKNKIGEFKYIDIKDLVNKIRNNTISEISAKTSLDTLNKLKNIEIIKQKTRTPKQKELLNLFYNLSDTILTDKTLEWKSQEDDENENKNENVNENDETLTSLDKDDDKIKILMYSDEYAETTDQNEKNIKIKKLNNYFDKIIDKSKSFEDQIESIEKVENLN